MKKPLPKILLSFLFIVALEFLTTAFLISQGRLVERDTLVRFISQYYFLNNFVNAGELPQWIPYLAHGTFAPFIYISQANIVMSLYPLFATWLKGANFLPLFYWSVFFDKCVLLIGTWLLGKHYFTSGSTRAFVTIAVTGSALWVSQSEYNLYFYYAVPLIMYFLHKFLETASWRYVLIAGNFLFLQVLSTSVYFIPVIALVIAVYTALAVAFNWQAVSKRFKNLSLNIRAVAALVLAAAPFILLYILLHTGRSEMVLSVSGRSPDGSVTLEAFLNHGVFKHLDHYRELILGLSWNFDCALYIGLVTLPFLVFALLFQRNRKTAPLLCLLLFLFLFSQGTWLSAVFYYTWPFMQYFRHLANTAVFIKLFLCFLAGFGFDYVFHETMTVGERRKLILSLIVSASVMLCLSAFFYKNAGSFQLKNDLIFFESLTPALKEHIFSENVLSSWFRSSSWYALLTAVVLALLTVLNGARCKVFFSSVTVILLACNIYGYNIHNTSVLTSRITAGQYNMLTFQKMPYAKRRAEHSALKSERAELVTSPVIKHHPETTYINLLLFHDGVSHIFRTNDWLKPLDMLIKAFLGVDITSKGAHPFMLDKNDALRYPLAHPAAGKLAGMSEDKVQFFNGAYTAGDDNLTALLLSHWDYAGNILFVSPTKNISGDVHVAAWPEGQALTLNKRLRLPYSVTRFDSNTLELGVVNENNKNAWLLYSDTFHPSWKASINGEPVPVFRGNLAYKAIPLKPGKNLIEFKFRSFWLTLFQEMVGINALFWFALVVWLFVRIVMSSAVCEDSKEKKKG